jgi:hypothetical protein
MPHAPAAEESRMSQLNVIPAGVTNFEVAP